MSRAFSKRIVRADVAVIGAGAAGICAAVSAARAGCKVALITDRAVLGGNASSEIRVNPMGAAYAPWNRFARETGIMEEIFGEVLFRAQRSGKWSWYEVDAVYFDLLFKEENITLELNSYISKVEIRDGKILAAEGNQSRSETVLRVEADTFIDCTGDGTVAFLAGCAYRTGAESRHEFDEFYGADEAQSGTMGTTVLFTSKVTAHKTEYTPPDWAPRFDSLPSAYRITHSIFPTADGNYGGFWWLEHGGALDCVKDDNDILLHLRKAVYGIWDLIKNSGLYPQSECHELDWIGYLGGKRESRRIVGEHIVTSRELMAQTDYFDNIGFTGWPIDIHPKDGYLDKGCGCTHYWLPGLANMPARMLIPKGVDNLLMAGRHVSATHEALGTLRLICTTAVMGQAAGTVAALALARKTRPIDLVKTDFKAVETALLKNDQRIVGRRLLLENDLAKKAALTVSSENPGSAENGESFRYADKSTGVIIPCKKLDELELLLSSDDEVDITVDIYLNDDNEINYRPTGLFKSLGVRVGDKKWYKLPVGLKNAKGGKVFAVIRRMPPVRVYGEKESYAGFTSFTFSGDELKYDTFFEVINSDYQTPFTVCCRYSERGENYAKENLTNGYIAPHAAPNVWVSRELGGDGEYLEFDFKKVEKFNEIELVFNTGLNMKTFNNPSMSRVPPETVKSYRIYTVIGGQETLYYRDRGNYKRFVRIAKSASAEKVRISFDQTHGSRYAQVYDVRIISD